MKDKRNLFLITVSIVMLISLLAMFSFAYFSADTDIQNTLPLNVVIEEGTSMTLTAVGQDAATINVSGSSMLTDKAGTVAGSSSPKIALTLESKVKAKCTYDIAWVWDTDSDNYSLSTGATKEFTISGTDGTNTLAETQISNYSTGLKLGTYEITNSSTSTTQTWNFTVNFYNLNVVQDKHADATYKGKIAIQNAECAATV
ncbi:MAG: hypothetical protein IJO63_04295 [Bacilli bacterium]|nr:hypothetical protein [Bacilli bacterium]